jgi:drug/metabolite transporter (DMT)-like permease
MHLSERTRAILQALLVTLLWSTSFVLIKTSLNEIPPLTFAGLRYSMAVLFLLPGLFKQRSQLKTLSGRDWWQLIILGLVFYAITQGGQFLSLDHLPAITFSLILNFTTVVVAIMGIVGLKEYPSGLQWFGIVVFIAGVLVYFMTAGVSVGEPIGIILAGITMIANAAASLLGRDVNRTKRIPTILITTISMGVGAVVLLVAGLAVEGWPHLTWQNWLVILWLGAVNTALAFQLWNCSLQHLSAVESSIINNTMLIQIAVLAWLFLDEKLNWVEIGGLALAAVGIFLANVKGGRGEKPTGSEEISPE